MNNKNNQNFIEEIEKNSKIFTEKMNKLNSGYDSENSQEKIELKKYKFTKKSKLYNKKNFEFENNYREKPFKKKLIIEENLNNKRKNKRYELDFNTINNTFENNKNKKENIFYSNTIENLDYKRNRNFNNDLNDEDIFNNNSDKKLIDELKQTIAQKSNFIKLLKSDLKEKEKLPTEEEFEELNYNYNNILKELKLVKNTIKDKDDEINHLKMKLDSIIAQNKNMKGVINKRESEVEQMKSSLNGMKEELKTYKNKMNDALTNEKRISRDYDILNKKYLLLISEKDKLNSNLEEQKNENFNLKKENIQLKKLIDKLREEINKLNKQSKNTSKNNSNNEKRNKIEYKNYELDNKEKENMNKNNKDINISINVKPKTKAVNNKIKNKFLVDEDSIDDKIYKNNDRYEDTEEKIIYNNNDDDSDEEDYSKKDKINSQKSIKDKDNNIKRNLKKVFTSNKENKVNNTKNKKNKISQSENKEFIALIKYKDKIIGCNREKIKSLIKGKEYQTIEKEINILTKEKEKIENELLKMPEKPRKLNDIKNKKEINDAINKIENDIKYIRALLKNTDDYYIN